LQLRVLLLQPPSGAAPGLPADPHTPCANESRSVPRSPLPYMPARSSCHSPGLLRSVATGSLPAPVDTSCLVPFQDPLMPVSYVLHWHKICRALHIRIGKVFDKSPERVN